eukprot:CAMPEP_0203652060 /NCGR_PEP_ID=MMETSP0088-20131115/29174_1 /ASSEMBLY_ACC=CAM_ASM_001087 /TAXON_ID=426623 /ORGANISM="Chaetoceros affinis, Strain CCMP159" /LENGTH=88 /DNA_ID=CAMNT_0050511461 /DNA_START=123 /DNA_END=389 /DNA_ORIENTATION=+
MSSAKELFSWESSRQVDEGYVHDDVERLSLVSSQILEVSISLLAEQSISSFVFVIGMSIAWPIPRFCFGHIFSSAGVDWMAMIVKIYI